MQINAVEVNVSCISDGKDDDDEDDDDNDQTNFDHCLSFEGL